MSSPAPQAASIICDRFKIVRTQDRDTVKIALDTDLPDFSEVMASVSRTYRQKGDADNDYSLDYFQEKSTVGQWRQARQISISHQAFTTAMDKKQRELSLAGIPMEVGGVSPDVEVSFVVPINQRHPGFGGQNGNLTGKAVTTQGSMRLVKAEDHFPFPLGSKGTPASRWASPKGLLPGHTYRLSRDTPLMPDDETLEPLTAVAARKTIPANGTISVINAVQRRGGLWYRVDALSGSSRIGVGLLNSDALIGQEIREVSGPR